VRWILLLVVLVCGCAKKQELTGSQWDSSQREQALQECKSSNDLEGALTDSSKQAAICECYVSEAVNQFAPSEFYSTDPAQEAKSDKILKTCGEKSGEILQFGSTRFGFRFLNQEKPKSALGRSLKKLVPKPVTPPPAAIEVPKAEEPKVVPAPATPVEKRPQLTPEEEVRGSTSRINENNRLVFHKPWTITDKDNNCLKKDDIVCCLILAEDAKYPFSFGVDDSIVFNGEGYDPLPQPKSAMLGGRSVIIQSEYDVLNPGRLREPEKSVSLSSHPPMAKGLVCQKWDPVQRRNYSVSIKEMKEVFASHANYEREGEYSKAPVRKHEGYTAPVAVEPVMPPVAPTHAAEAPVAAAHPVDSSKPAKPELPIYGMKDYLVYNFTLKDGMPVEMYRGNGKFLIVGKPKAGEFKILGHYSPKLQRGGLGLLDPLEEEYSDAGFSFINHNGKLKSFSASLDDGRTFPRSVDYSKGHPEFTSDQAASANELVVWLNALKDQSEKLKAKGFVRAHEYRWPNLYKKGNDLFYLDAKNVPQPLFKRADGTYDFGVKNNSVESINNQMKAYSGYTK